MKKVETAKLRGSTIGRTSISIVLSRTKYKPKMTKMATTGAREQIRKNGYVITHKLPLAIRWNTWF